MITFNSVFPVLKNKSILFSYGKPSVVFSFCFLLIALAYDELKYDTINFLNVKNQTSILITVWGARGEHVRIWIIQTQNRNKFNLGEKVFQKYPQLRFFYETTLTQLNYQTRQTSYHQFISLLPVYQRIRQFGINVCSNSHSHGEYR